jgi:hypothetical protein
MSQVFSIPGSSLGEGVVPAVILFGSFLGLITGVIIYHAVAYRTAPMDRAPGDHDQPAGGARPGWRLSTDIRTTQTMIYRPIQLGR